MQDCSKRVWEKVPLTSSNVLVYFYTVYFKALFIKHDSAVIHYSFFQY